MKRAARAALRFHRHPSRRPYWQMAGLAILWPAYKLAERFVNWMDRAF